MQQLRAITTTGFVILLPVAVFSQPQMQAARLTAQPVIDGDVMEDTAWSTTVPASGFRQVKPDDGEASTQRTEVRIGFTDTALYIGVVAYDDDPSAIIVSEWARASSTRSQ